MEANTIDSNDSIAILEALPQAISLHALDGRIVHANREVCRIYQQDPSRIIGLSCDEVFHSEQPPCPHRDVVSEGKGVLLEAQLQRMGRTYDLTVSPVFASAGDVHGYIRLMSDVTEKHRAQQQLLKAERLATVGQMISGIAHDISTPLNIVSGYCEYLLMKTRSGGEGHKELSTILQQTRRIGVFIKQMLDLARPSPGRADAIGVQGFIAETLNLMGHHLRRAGVRVTLTCEGHPPLVYGDGPRLRQALFRLLLNASNDIGAGSAIEVTVNEAPGCSNLIRIAIMGRGLDGQAHDFSKMHSGLSGRAAVDGDMGVGPSLVREVLGDFGATLEAETLDQKGVALILLLPAGVPRVTASRA